MTLRDEYREFCGQEANEPNERLPKLSEAIRGRVDSDLNPNSTWIATRILLIHGFFGALSLLICHQFGLNPFGTSWSIDAWAMQMAGHGFCMAICGGIFVGGTVLLVSMVFSRDEMRLLGRAIHVSLAALIIGSLVLFWVANARLDQSGVVIWSLSAWTTGWLVYFVQQRLEFKII